MTGQGLAAAASLGLAAAVLVRSAPHPRRLAAASIDLRGSTASRRGSPERPPPGPAPGAGLRGRRSAAALAGLGVLALVGGVPGVVLGGLAGAFAYTMLGRLESPAAMQRRERLAADVPVVAHLMGAAVAAGASPLAALEVTADAVGGPAAEDLRMVAAHLRLGADPTLAWSRLDLDGPLGRLGRTVSRALATGAPLADALDRLSDELRERRRYEVDRRARAVGVRAAGPLGLCFLPAFLLVGVVPVVIGVAEHVLGTVL